MPCPKVFVQDPDLYLTSLGIEIPCAVNENAWAILDLQHRIFVNFEAYYFSERRLLQQFRGDPLRYCGILTDPVTRQRFRPAKNSRPYPYKNRSYYFVSDSTYAVFVAAPDSFAFPRVKMLPKSGDS